MKLERNQARGEDDVLADGEVSTWPATHVETAALPFVRTAVVSGAILSFGFMRPSCDRGKTYTR